MIPVFIAKSLENDLKKSHKSLYNRLLNDIETRLSINPTRLGNRQRINYVGRGILPLYELKYEDVSARIYYFVEQDKVLIFDYYVNSEFSDFVNILVFTTKNKQKRFLKIAHKTPINRRITKKSHRRIK